MNILNTNVGFNQSSTEAQALGTSANASTIYFTTDTKAIVVNGNKYGGYLSKAQEDYLKEKIEEEIQSKFAVSLSANTNPQAVGSPITYTVNVKYDNTAVDPTSISATVNGSTVTPTKSSTGVYTITVNCTTATDGQYAGLDQAVVVNASYTKDGVACTSSASSTARFRAHVLYGVSTAETLTLPIPTAFSKVEKALTSAGTYTWTNSDAEAYYYICIPNGTTIAASLDQTKPQGVEGPLPVYFNKQSNTLKDTKVTYTVYRIADKQAKGSTHTIKFS